MKIWFHEDHPADRIHWAETVIVCNVANLWTFFVLNKFDTDSIRFYKEVKNHDNELIWTSAFFFFTFVTSWTLKESFHSPSCLSNRRTFFLLWNSVKALRMTEKYITLLISMLFSRSCDALSDRLKFKFDSCSFYEISPFVSHRGKSYMNDITVSKSLF